MPEAPHEQEVGRVALLRVRWREVVDLVAEGDGREAIFTPQVSREALAVLLGDAEHAVRTLGQGGFVGAPALQLAPRTGS